jgi:DNA (cytosine-5)-methyltransferase 1
MFWHCCTAIEAARWKQGSSVKVAGLFAGIGGLETGLADAGHEAVMLCEIWDPARAVLKNRLSGIPCEKDVCKLASLPANVEILTAGFPCQDLSQAGLTAGIDGSRSSLVSEVFRLLDQRPVPWVVLENVSFMLQLQGGRAMTRLVEAFEERGYRWAYRVVNSLSFLPQRRERVLFVATKTEVDPASVLLTDETEPQIPTTDLNGRAHGFFWTEGVRGLGWAVDAVPTLKSGSTIGIPSPPAIILPSGDVITPDIRDAERLQGFVADWTTPAESVARPSTRWGLVGNAVTVPVAAWLGGRLNEPGEFSTARDGQFDKRGRWPRAARFDGHRRFVVRINGYPVWRTRPPLTQFLVFPGKPLSARATAGFLSRTERSSLRFADGFQNRLRDHLARQRTPMYAIAAE